VIYHARHVLAVSRLLLLVAAHAARHPYPWSLVFTLTLLVCSCPTGKFSPLEGGKLCFSCPAGKFSLYGRETCFNCPRGKFSKLDSERCGITVTCPDGKFAVQKPGSSWMCTVCLPGRYSKDGTASVSAVVVSAHLLVTSRVTINILSTSLRSNGHS
jgi:hypothetical protein